MKIPWRGVDSSTRRPNSTGNKVTSQMTFKAGDDGNGVLDGVFRYNFEMISFSGMKATAPPPA
jgi:hypothetical protein